MSRPITLPAPKANPDAVSAYFRRCSFLAALICFSNPVSAQCSLTCNQDLQVSISPSGLALITVSMLSPNAATNCPGANFQITLKGPQNLPLPNPLTCAHLGIPVTATLKDLNSGNSCTATLELYDALAPTLTCPTKFVFCNQDPGPELTGFPTLSDNCTPSAEIDLNFFDTETQLSCNTFQNGFRVLKRIDRLWIAEDAAGNSSQCTQTVWVKHITFNDIQFPPSRDGVAAPALNCDQNPYDLELTGEPTVEGVPVGASPQCEIVVTHSDQVVNFCAPAGYTVIRTWTAIDFCIGELLNRIQVIKVQDKTPPVFEAPDDFTVGTDGFLCSATVTFPQVATTDDCSSVTVQPTWQFGSGFGPYTAVPLGEHIVTYKATDACGNASTRTARVTVVDVSPPQAICSSGIQVSVTSSGTAFLNAGAIDAGSADNCGAVTLAAARAGNEEEFGSSVQFTCADVGKTIPLILRVTDEVGLENFCDMEVSVRDFLKPSLQCPPAKTITCKENYQDLNLTGNATASDNCGLKSFGYQDQTNIGPCNIGSVTRLWTAADSSGNTRTCVQSIILNPVSNFSVVFPSDKTVNYCDGPAAYHPNAVGIPQINGQTCVPPNITHSDQIFYDVPVPGCFRIVRQWLVTDFCVYNPNTGAGQFSKAQVINVVDNLPPVLEIVADISAAVNRPDCSAQVDIPPAFATDCSTVTVSHNSAYASASGADASGVYPAGTHSVVFTAVDLCGNTAQKTLLIFVADQTPPAAKCKTLPVFDLGPDSLVVITSADIDGGSADDCSAGPNLTMTLSVAQFTCADIGLRQVELSVSDAKGNVATCQTLIEITDTAGVCMPQAPPEYFVVEGNVKNPYGASVDSIAVRMTTGGLIKETVCDTAGHYQFDSLTSGVECVLRPRHNAGWLNGVSTFDLVLMSKHILGIDTLDTPYKIIAADANRSGSVTTFDVVQFRKLILGIIDTMPGNTSWRFVDAGFVFPNPINPFETAFPDSVALPILDSSYHRVEFIGFKVGDANNSANPSLNRSTDQKARLLLPDASLEPGETRSFTLYFAPPEGCDGFQFELRPHSGVKVLSMASLLPDLLENQHYRQDEDGALRVSWNGTGNETFSGQALFNLSIVSEKAFASLLDAFSLGAAGLTAEAYASDRGEWFEMELSAADSPGKVLFVPNPFSELTELRLETADNEDALIEIFDAAGKSVYRYSGVLSDKSSLTIDGKYFRSSGIYFYKLTIGGGEVYTGKLLYQLQR